MRSILLALCLLFACPVIMTGQRKNTIGINVGRPWQVGPMFTGEIHPLHEVKTTNQIELFYQREINRWYLRGAGGASIFQSKIDFSLLDHLSGIRKHIHREVRDYRLNYSIALGRVITKGKLEFSAGLEVLARHGLPSAATRMEDWDTAAIWHNKLQKEYYKGPFRLGLGPFVLLQYPVTERIVLGMGLNYAVWRIFGNTHARMTERYQITDLTTNEYTMLITEAIVYPIRERAFWDASWEYLTYTFRGGFKF